MGAGTAGNKVVNERLRDGVRGRHYQQIKRQNAQCTSITKEKESILLLLSI